jgi:hypothetical protein
MAIFVLFMVRVGIGTPETRATKTADPNQEAAVKARRDFCSADFSPLRIERHLPFSHRRISPSPVGSTGFPMRS